MIVKARVCGRERRKKRSTFGLRINCVFILVYSIATFSCIKELQVYKESLFSVFTKNFLDLFLSKTFFWREIDLLLFVNFFNSKNKFLKNSNKVFNKISNKVSNKVLTK